MMHLVQCKSFEKIQIDVNQSILIIRRPFQNTDAFMMNIESDLIFIFGEKLKRLPEKKCLMKQYLILAIETKDFTDMLMRSSQ